MLQMYQFTKNYYNLSTYKKNQLQPFHLQQTLEGLRVCYHQNDNICKCFKFPTFVTQALTFISSCSKLLMPHSRCKLNEIQNKSLNEITEGPSISKIQSFMHFVATNFMQYLPRELNPSQQKFDLSNQKTNLQNKRHQYQNPYL